MSKIKFFYKVFQFWAYILLLIPSYSQKPKELFNTWDFVGIGGGGAMFNQTISPHNPNIALVACDMGGSYITLNGGKSWRIFNLHGMVQFFVFDPINPNIIYAKSSALYKSADLGYTWKMIFPANVKGMVAKGDHAEGVLITKDKKLYNMLAMAIDPQNSQKLYAAITIDNKNAFYISKDGGKKWAKERDLENSTKNIYINPFSPIQNRTIYITSGQGISMKTNKNWQENAIPKGHKQLNHFTAGFNKKNKNCIIYAISGKSYFNEIDDESGIFYTENGGETWENRENGLRKFMEKDSKFPEFRTIATCQNQPEIVYLSYNNLKTHKDSLAIGVAKSSDFGKTWQLVWKDVNNKPGSNMSPDWINDRFGAGWGENPFSIGVAPKHPNIVYTGDFGRTLKTSDGGKSWQQQNSRQTNSSWTSTGLEVTTSYSMAFDPFDKNHWFVPTTDIGLIESTNGGKSWNSATKQNGIPKNWENTTYWLCFDPKVKGKAWAVMSGNHDLPRPKMFRKNGVAHFTGGILKTTNSGKTWVPVSTDIGEGAFTHIIFDPKSDKNNRTLYACAFGKGLYKSTDDGNTWQQKNRGIISNEPFAWQCTLRESDNALFLVVSRRSDDGSIGNEKDGAIYISKDGAESWQKINLPFETNGPTSLLVDENNSDKIIISAWGRKTQGQFTPDIGGGIFVTIDAGKTWTNTLKNDQHIGAITYDSKKNRYYAVGFEGSAYYSDDGANTWVRIKGYNFKWGQRIEPDPSNTEKIFINTYGGGIWHGPAKGDLKAFEGILP